MILVFHPDESDHMINMALKAFQLCQLEGSWELQNLEGGTGTHCLVSVWIGN